MDWLSCFRWLWVDVRLAFFTTFLILQTESTPAAIWQLMNTSHNLLKISFTFHILKLLYVLLLVLLLFPHHANCFIMYGTPKLNNYKTAMPCFMTTVLRVLIFMYSSLMLTYEQVFLPTHNDTVRIKSRRVAAPGVAWLISSKWQTRTVQRTFSSKTPNNWGRTSYLWDCFLCHVSMS